MFKDNRESNDVIKPQRQKVSKFANSLFSVTDFCSHHFPLKVKPVVDNFELLLFGSAEHGIDSCFKCFLLFFSQGKSTYGDNEKHTDACKNSKRPWPMLCHCRSSSTKMLPQNSLHYSDVYLKPGI